VQVTSQQRTGTVVLDLDHLESSATAGWAAYVGGVLWAVEQTGARMPGMDLVIDSRVPVGAGLSSSAALECAVAVAACTLAGDDLDDAMRQVTVAACMRAEQDIVGAPTGGMDQTIAMFARRGHALLIDFRDGRHEQIPWRMPDVRLLVVDTRVTHALNDGQYGDRRAECDRVAELIGVDRLCDVDDPEGALREITDDQLRRRARHVFTENQRVGAAVHALRDQDPSEVGRIFTDSHASLRDDYQVSCVELDLVVEAALAAGAYGARMTGGGFGGSAITLVEPRHLASVRAEITKAFADAGLRRPRFLLVEPSEGARRVR